MTTLRDTTISVEATSKWFGSVLAVNDISLEISPGITGLLGPNGAGKTTLMQMISGLVRPSKGVVKILGTPTRGNTNLFRSMGVMPEQESVYQYLTGRELVMLAAKMQGLSEPGKAVDNAIKKVDLESAQNRKLGTYSRGMRQRMRLAATIVHDPEILILDEPLNGTDPRQRLEFQKLMQRLSSEGRTILISSHVLDEVEVLANKILLIVSGRLAASGDFRSIREKLDDRPFKVRIMVDKTRDIASTLMKLESVESVSIDEDGSIVILSKDVERIQRSITSIAAQHKARLYSVIPLDDSLESVFSYVVQR